MASTLKDDDDDDDDDKFTGIFKIFYCKKIFEISNRLELKHNLY